MSYDRAYTQTEKQTDKERLQLYIYIQAGKPGVACKKMKK